MSQAILARPFQPTAATQNGAVTSSAATITIGAVSDVNGAVRLVNVGSQTVFVRFDGTAPDTSTAMPILANTVEVFSMPTGKLTIKHIAAASGSTLYVTPGMGS